MPIGIGAGTAIAGAIAGGTTVAGSVMQSKAAKKSATVQQAAADAALAWEKEQEATRRQEYEEERAHDWEMDEKKLAYQTKQDVLDRERQARLDAMSAEDRSRRIAQGAPFAAMAGQGANSLMSLLSSGGGGSQYYIDQPTYQGVIPQQRPLPTAAGRAVPTMQDLLTRRAV